MTLLLRELNLILTRSVIGLWIQHHLMEARAYANENRIIVMEDFLKQKFLSGLVGFKVKLT